MKKNIRNQTSSIKTPFINVCQGRTNILFAANYSIKVQFFYLQKYNFVPLDVEKYLQDIFQCSIQNSSKSVSSEIKNITHVVWLHLLITCRLAKNVGLFWPPVISNESFLQFITDTFCRFLFIKYKFKIIWNYRDIFCMNMNLIISCCVAMMTNVNTLSISFFFNFKTIFLTKAWNLLLQLMMREYISIRLHSITLRNIGSAF